MSQSIKKKTRQGQFMTKCRIEFKGRECSEKDHEGERFLPWSEFHLQPSGANGRNPRCKTCVNRIYRARRDANRGKPKVPTKAKANRELEGDIQTACDSTWDGSAAAAFLSGR